MIGRTRGWLPETIDGWNAKRPGRGVGGGRPPKKQVTGIRGWLRTNDLRFWRPPLYVWCAPSGICGVRRAASISRRHACRGNRNRLCINTNNRSRGSLEVVRIFRLSRSSRACRPRLGRAAGLESSRHRVSAWEAALRLRRLLSRIGMTHFARDAPAGYGADAEFTGIAAASAGALTLATSAFMFRFVLDTQAPLSMMKLVRAGKVPGAKLEGVRRDAAEEARAALVDGRPIRQRCAGRMSRKARPAGPFTGCGGRTERENTG